MCIKWIEKEKTTKWCFEPFVPYWEKKRKSTFNLGNKIATTLRHSKFDWMIGNTSRKNKTMSSSLMNKSQKESRESNKNRSFIFFLVRALTELLKLKDKCRAEDVWQRAINFMRANLQCFIYLVNRFEILFIGRWK